MARDIKINTGNGRTDKLPIEHFSLNMFEDHPSIVMIAKRGSGKSWVIRAIMEHFADIPVGLIISKTDRMNSFYGNFFPDAYIHYEYKSDIIDRVLMRQKLIIDKKNAKNKIGKNIDSRCYVVMDDCLADKGKWSKDIGIQEILFNGRHYHIMYILAMQYPLGIGPQLRGNIDYVFLLADDKITNLKKMHDHYAGMFPTFESFRQIFGQLTTDYGAMVIVDRGKRDSLFEKIFWYKAPDLSKLNTQIGCSQFRNFHKNNYDNEWLKKADKFNADEFLLRKKQNKSMVVIEKVDKDAPSRKKRTVKEH